jgi:hypothetical protein
LASAQNPSILLDVDEVTAVPGDIIPLSVLIQNITDSIAAFQVSLRLDRLDIVSFDADTVFATCYECSDSACTSVVAVPCTLFQAKALDVSGTLIEDWEYAEAGIFGPSDIRVEAIGNTDFGGETVAIPPHTDGILFKVMARVSCDIPDTVEDRTVLISIDSLNTLFSSTWGPLSGPIYSGDGSVTAEREFILCPYQGDLEPDGLITALDLTAIVDALFEEGPNPQDPCCPSFRFDLDCDGFTTALDLAAMVDHLFAGGPGPCDPATP